MAIGHRAQDEAVCETDVDGGDQEKYFSIMMVKFMLAISPLIPVCVRQSQKYLYQSRKKALGPKKSNEQ